MSKQYRFSEGLYVLISNKRDPLRAYPKRYWDVEIVEQVGAKCEYQRNYSTLARRNRRAGA